MLKGLVKATVPVVKLGVKVGLCGGAVYVTKEVFIFELEHMSHKFTLLILMSWRSATVLTQAGVWGDSKQGAAALKNLQVFFRLSVCSLPGSLNAAVHFQGLTLNDVQTALGEDCPIAPVFDYVSVPEEVTGAVDTVSASVADVNKVMP